MQVAVIEYARNVLGWADANSTEFDTATAHPVIDLMPDQQGLEKGGTMRLGSYPCEMAEGTRMAGVYGVRFIAERHRHRYEYNNTYREQLEKAGLSVCGTSPDGHLVEAVELPGHPYFIAVQFHPEFKSRPNRAHPLFTGFLAQCLECD
jgi:CTP synthase